MEIRSKGDVPKTRILFLAANPDGAAPLHAGREVRRIRERLAAAPHRSAVEIAERWAVRPGDLQQALAEVEPHVVHFSGHGTTEYELMLEGDDGSPELVGMGVLAELFRVHGAGVRIVVLSACHSLPQAEAVAEHVDCAIGMRRAIGSEAAAEFSAALYHAVASGGSIRRAFDAARVHLEARGIPEHRTPQLVIRKDHVDPDQILLVARSRAGGASSLPIPHNLPPRRIFIGRTSELAQIQDALREKNRSSITQAALWGLGGVGKTALALEYAHRALERRVYPGGIWWVAAEGRPRDALRRLEAVLRVHASELMHMVPQRGSTTQALDAQRRALEAVDEPSLIVLDNVSERGFAPLLPGNKVCVLVTTRDRSLTLGDDARLDVLSPDEARVLATRIAPAAEGEGEALDRVVQMLGGLAAAVEVAARAVKLWAGGWVSYEKLLFTRLGEALDREKDRSEFYPAGVSAAIDASMARCGEPARRLLEGFAAFAPEAVPLPWAFAAAELDPEDVAAHEALGDLEGLGLVTADRATASASLHRLVHARARERAEPRARRDASLRAAQEVARWIEGAVGLAAERERLEIYGVAPRAAPFEHLRHLREWGEQAELLDVRLAHVEEARVAASLGGETETWCSIAVGLAFYLSHRHMDHWDRFAARAGARRGGPEDRRDAQALIARALRVAERSYGPDHPLVARSLETLALPQLWDLPQEEAAARPAPALEPDGDEEPGPEHPLTARRLSNQAKALTRAGDVAQARTALEQALPILEKTYGPEHPIVAVHLRDLAVVHWHLGDAAGERSLLLRVLSLYENALGAEHWFVNNVRSYLANPARAESEAGERRQLMKAVESERTPSSDQGRLDYRRWRRWWSRTWARWRGRAR